MTSSGDESRSGFPRAVWWLMLAWVIVAIIAVIWGIPNEEDDLTNRASDALAGTGLEVEFDGRDATITGTADQPTIDAAEETVYGLRGVRTVDVGDTRVAAPTTTTTAAPATTTTTAAPTTTTAAPVELGAPNFGAHYAGGTLDLTGTLPGQDLIDSILGSAEATYGAGNVNNAMTVGDVENSAWLAQLPDLFGVAEGLDPWTFDVDGGNASYSGMGANADAVAAKLAAMNDFTAGSGLTSTDIAIEVNPTAVAADLTGLLAEGANFETGSATLNTEATARLDQVIEIMLANPSTSLTVEGHTDNQGDDAANQALSEERAQTVVDYLIDGGVGSDRLTAVGYGEDQPIADNDTAEGRAQNRRIEFVVNEGE